MIKHISIETISGHKFPYTPLQFKVTSEMGLRLMKGYRRSFEVIDEKLFKYSVIKYEITYSDTIYFD